MPVQSAMIHACWRTGHGQNKAKPVNKTTASTLDLYQNIDRFAPLFFGKIIEYSNYSGLWYACKIIRFSLIFFFFVIIGNPWYFADRGSIINFERQFTWVILRFLLISYLWYKYSFLNDKLFIITYLRFRSALQASKMRTHLHYIQPHVQRLIHADLITKDAVAAS